MTAGPLDGVRVFDMTLWMVGPWASTQLGALGADVIHIEQPGVDPRTPRRRRPALDRRHLDRLHHLEHEQARPLPRPQIPGRPRDRLPAAPDLRCLPRQHASRRRRPPRHGLRTGPRRQPEGRLHGDHRLGRNRPDARQPRRRRPVPVLHRFLVDQRTARRPPRGLSALHPDGRQHRQRRRPGRADGPARAPPHRQGTANPRRHAARRHGPAERPHRRVPRHRRAAPAARLRRLRRRPRPGLPLPGQPVDRHLSHQRSGVGTPRQRA